MAAGFAYTTDGSGTKIGFVVNGSHTWNSGSASWDVKLGYSNRGFQGELSGAITQELDNGAVALTGALHLTAATGQPIKFNLNLQTRFKFDEANNLIFTADVSTTGGHLNYDLKLEGTFKFDGIDLTFSAKMSSTGDVEFKLAASSNLGALKIQLAFVLDKHQNEIDVSFTFTLVMHFVNGKLVKDPPQPTNAQPQLMALNTGGSSGGRLKSGRSYRRSTR